MSPAGVPEDVDVGRRRGAEPVVEAEGARRRAATYIPCRSEDPTRTVRHKRMRGGGGGGGGGGHHAHGMNRSIEFLDGLRAATPRRCSPVVQHDGGLGGVEVDLAAPRPLVAPPRRPLWIENSMALGNASQESRFDRQKK